MRRKFKSAVGLELKNNHSCRWSSIQGNLHGKCASIRNFQKIEFNRTNESLGREVLQKEEIINPFQSSEFYKNEK